MTHKKIILAGGNGYLGRVFADYYKTRADRIIILSRKPWPVAGNCETVVWDGETTGGWVQQLEGADLLINLCGKNVNCRYNEANRAEIISSRLNPTRLLGAAIRKLEQPPALWINVTSATIYRHAEDRPQDETGGEEGAGFSVDVCRQWEQSFFNETTSGTRKVALRMGIVLGKSDGVFPRLRNLVLLGMGGKHGNGRQMVSWIHELDAARCTEWLLNQTTEGIYNCTAPQPINNAALMTTIRKAYGIPAGMPAPAWLLEIGARLIGTETELMLKSRWVLPARLQDEGFRFQYPDIKSAVYDIVKSKQ
ncbi:MAG: TIGR01777 family protein [Sphingobacteriales bacterium]|nr:MAG: TIGR01777 family protein [Sphingobacteriales bacterium]